MKMLKLGRSIVALSLSAGLTMASFGPGACQALAANIQTGAAKSLPGNPQVTPLPNASFPASPGSFSGIAGTPVSLNSTIPSLNAPEVQASAGQVLVAASPFLGTPAVPVVPTGPAAIAPISSLKSSVENPAQASGQWSGVTVESLGKLSQDAVELPKAVEGSASASKEWAQDSFSYLKGETDSFAVSASPVEGGSSEGKPTPSGLAAPTSGKSRSWAKLIGKAVTILGAGAAIGTFTFPETGYPSPGPIVEAAAEAAKNSGVLPFLGQAGYAVGNVLGAIFSLPQVYKTFEDGNSKGTPMWRAAVLAAANLALGVVSATVANQWLWGVQNIFAAVTILTVIPIGAMLSKQARSRAPPAAAASQERRGRFQAITGNHALLATLAVAAVGAGLSFGIYYAALATVPAMLAHLLGAAGVAKLVLGIQAVTGGMYFLLFLPDILSILRGKAPNGFTPGVSLSFFAASLGFILWTGQTVLETPSGTPKHQQFLIYLALNIAYAVVSLASWLITRRPRKSRSG
ncbi:MAG: hypothetical protein HZB91_02360 [Elusimicrobia bacterium]|nr:hypothetical protein [Elusimicrobiota bacterium]